MFSGCELYRSDDTYIVLTLLVPQLSSEFIPYIIINTAQYHTAGMDVRIRVALIWYWYPLSSQYSFISV